MSVSLLPSHHCVPFPGWWHRRQNLPELGGVYEMDADLPDQLWRDGHVLLRGLLSRDEVKAYRDVIHYVIPKVQTAGVGCAAAAFHGIVVVISSSRRVTPPTLFGVSLDLATGFLSPWLRGRQEEAVYQRAPLLPS